MRLDKFLALQGLGSRTEVRALVRAGRVTVNGETASNPGNALREAQDAVALDAVPLAFRDALHIMLNKPAGVVTAAEDTRHPTVQALLPRHATAMGCMPIGRLDMDTEGLLLFTTDGRLAHRLLSPKRHVDKVYEAEVDAPLDESDVKAFADGVALSDFQALPAGLTILSGAMAARVVVQEGKYHQVKRMFAARGKHVTRLRRIAFGGIPLDPALAPGMWRELTEDEFGRLTQASGGKQHG